MSNRNFSFVFGLWICSLVSVCASASEGWYQTYEEAQQIADRNGFPLLLHFHATYCGPCRQMDSQVFSRPEVQQQLRKGLVAVDIDVQQRPDLAQKYGASSIPRDIVVYPGQSPQTLNNAFQPASAYMTMLREIASKGRVHWRSREAEIAAQQPQQKERPAMRPAVEERAAVAQRVLGIEGFCPVLLVRERQWVAGRRELTENWQGIDYRFSSEEARDKFLEAPRKYSPQNLGCDPVVLYAEQQAVMGRIQYGVFFDNQLFLFDSAENRSEFKANPLRYGRIQHALKVDDLTRRSLN